MIVVSNSSPLIALAVIDQLLLLQRLFTQIAIPSFVAAEIRPSIPVLPSFIREHKLTLSLPDIVLRPNLGSGEREVIALAIILKAGMIILDDLPARKTARAAGLNVVGTLGILLAAKRKKVIANVRGELDKLVANSFFLSPELYTRILEAAGENSPT